VDWLILYHDGSTFSSEDGGPEEAPRTGVMDVYYCSEETGVSVEHSNDGIWIWRDGLWMGTDNFGWHDYLFNQPGWLVMLFGRTLRDVDWQSKVKTVASEIMKTPKSGRY
jgi:hypothetical protein